MSRGKRVYAHGYVYTYTYTHTHVHRHLQGRLVATQSRLTETSSPLPTFIATIFLT